MVLLTVLVMLLIIVGASSSFIWWMNQQQTRAGQRYRSTAALAAAEAGVHQALSILETVAPDRRTPGRRWRPAAHSETVRVGHLEGRFTVSLTDGPGGAIFITSRGEVGGAVRRLRARVYLASPALLSGIYGAGFVRLERPPAATFVLPYGAGIGDRPWIHIAAERGVWFATTDVSINNPDALFDAAPGPVDVPPPLGADTRGGRPGPVRFLLAGGAELTLGPGHQRLDIQQLRMMGVYVEGVVWRTAALHPLPEVDRTHFRATALANTANASLNEAAGRYLGDADLERKRDSLYTEREFERLQDFLKVEPAAPRLKGIIYVAGGVALLEGERVHIGDGALVAESTVHLSHGSELAITHTSSTRTFPGLIVLDNGALYVTERARLRVHGLVYASRGLNVDQGAHVDVVGAVAGHDPNLSFRNTAATVIIRYDPAVLGTPGLRVADDAPVVAWVAAWEELP